MQAGRQRTFGVTLEIYDILCRSCIVLMISLCLLPCWALLSPNTLTYLHSKISICICNCVCVSWPLSAAIESVNWTISVTINGFYFQLRQNKNPKPKFMCRRLASSSAGWQSFYGCVFLCPFVCSFVSNGIFCFCDPGCCCHLGGHVLAKYLRRLCNLLQFPATESQCLSSCCLFYTMAGIWNGSCYVRSRAVLGNSCRA